MLLTTPRLRDESGVAMPAAVGVLAVTLVLTSVVLVAVTSAIGTTTSTRAGVQAEAAAEAGIAAARAGLIAGSCAAEGGRYTSPSGTVPEYDARVQRPGAGGWVDGCPIGLGTQIRIVSTGYAEDVGVGGVSGRDEATLEAVLGAVTTSTGIQPSGPAIYAYRSQGFGGSGTLVSVDGSQPSVMVYEGDVACAGASSGVSDWIINDGGLVIGGSCKISGNVWVSERVVVEGATTVTANLVANAVTISGSSRVNANVWSATDATISGGGSGIGGALYATSLSLTGSSSITGNAWIRGHAYVRSSTVGGNLTAATVDHASSNIGSLTVTGGDPGPYPIATPAKPLVPGWVDFGYDPADWTGFAEVTMSGNCDYNAFVAKIASLGGQPGLIDARACSNAVSISSWQKLSVSQDLAIVANRFDLGGSGGITATRSGLRLWLITPDEVADGRPTCPGRFEIDGVFSIDKRFATLIYTGCRAEIASALDIEGQLYAGEASVAGAAKLGYEAVGLPGVDLSTGTSSPTGGSEATRPLVSLRNLNG